MAKESPNAPKSLKAPKRTNTSYFEASWSLGSGASSGDAAYTGQIIYWEVKTATQSGGKYGKPRYKSLKTTKLGRSTTSNKVYLNRAKYYPNKTVLLTGIQVYVEARNNRGSAKTGPKQLKFYKPKKPTISLSYEESSGLLTIEIEAPKTDQHDRYDCQYHVYRKDKKTDSSRYKSGKELTALDRSGKELNGTNKQESFKLYSMVETAYLKDGASITFRVTATSRGFAGNSETATATLVVSSPTRAEITKIDVSNKNKLDLAKNLLKVNQADGSVRVFYRSAEGPQSAAYDTKQPNKYTLERAVTPYNINTEIKAELYDSWTSDIDTNEGTTSEAAQKYIKKTAPRYINPKLQKKTEKVQYYTARDKKTNTTTAKFPAWQLEAYKSATYKVGGKKVKRYGNITKATKGDLNIYKAYNNKTKKWKKNIPAYLKNAYSKKTYDTKKKKGLTLYKSWTKTSHRQAKLYTCLDTKTAKTVKNIPEWKISKYAKGSGYEVNVSKKVGQNPSDGIMGEPLLDVFQAMGFSSSGGVYDKRVWYRIKCEKYGMVEYSRPYEAVEFRAPKPTAKKDYAGFMRLMQSESNPGTSIIGTVGWNNAARTDEGVDNPNWVDAQWTTIVEYSKYKMASKSNEKASELEIDWHNSVETHKLRQKEYASKVKQGDFTYKKSDGTVDKQAIRWKKSADFALYGLEPGVPIFLWAKRHMVLGEFDEYGPRTTAPEVGSGYFPFTPIDNPTAVVAYVPDYYLIGEDLTISWMHNATCPQKSWAIYAFPAENMDEYTSETNVGSIPKHLIAAGTGKDSSYTIPASELNKIIGNKCAQYTKGGKKKAFTINKNLGIVVGVSTGGSEIYSFQDSNKKYVEVNVARIVLNPTCRLWVPDNFTTLGSRVVYVFTNTPKVSGVINIYAKDDISEYRPDKTYRQSADECVWNYYIPASKFKSANSALSAQEKLLSGISQFVSDNAAHKCAYVAKVTIPYAVKSLIHSCRYTVEAYTISDISQAYVSPKREKTITCKYSHPPNPPSKASQIIRDSAVPSNYNDVIDEIISPKTENGTYTMPLSPTVYIVCKKPVNYASTDRCTVYRVTPDSCDIIAEDVEFETIVVDRYAPYSKTADLRYIIATRTAEGRMEWRTLTYKYPRHGLRFDWGDPERERSIELPFDIELNPSYDKNVRVTSHMDGTTQAYFNPGVSKSESISTKLVRLGNPHQFEMVKELGQYEGTCFFRAHDGSAYECVVRVSGLSNSYSSQTSPVTLELTRVTLSDRFKPQLGSSDFRKSI